MSTKMRRAPSVPRASAGMVLPQVLREVVWMRGGWDQLTPSLALTPGFIRDGENFEIAVLGGYARIGGYERYDGRPRPSQATFAMIQVVSFVNVPSVGQTLTGATSGATGVIVAVGANYVAITKATGTFQTPETVKVGTTTIGTTTALTVSLTAQQIAQYTDDAAAQYRTDIGIVPGSGPIRGVFDTYFGGGADKTFAFRDNAGGTATLLYQSSASGWQLVTFYNEVSFTAGGTAVPADGATLTQGSNSATIKRVVLQSGSWAAGTAAGRFIVTTPTPGNFSSGSASVSGGASVTLSGAQTAITLSTGGKFVAVMANFSGSSSTMRLYGCDGVNRGWEFDGSVFVPITTGSSPDQPKYVIAHKNHLVFAFGASILISSPGLPYDYTAANGSAELACGNPITGFAIQPGDQTVGALYITSTQTAFVLYGTGATDWNLVSFPFAVGAQDYSLQNLSETYALSPFGIVSLQRTLAYGNFVPAVMTRRIQTYINEQQGRVACSTIHRGKGHYRLFFNDGTALYYTILDAQFTGGATNPFLTNLMGRYLGCIRQRFAGVPYCAWNTMRSTGEEVTFVGDQSTGYVYLWDVGSSFDGASLDAYLTLAWDPQGLPRVLKTYKRASLEVQGNFWAQVQLSYELGYGTTEFPASASVSYDTDVVNVADWDTAVWDSFIWDGQTLAPVRLDLAGTAENIQLTLRSTTTYIQPFTLDSLILHYIPRRAMR